jgi:hypothetical protein
MSSGFIEFFETAGPNFWNLWSHSHVAITCYLSNPRFNFSLRQEVKKICKWLVVDSGN